jgi:hypothetical protein
MNEYRVVEVIDPQTVRVEPPWNWESEHGDLVHINGMQICPKKGHLKQEIKQELQKCLVGQRVELRNTVKEVDSSYVMAYVHLNGHNITHIIDSAE